MSSLAEMMPHRVILTSPLSREECLARLKDATNPWWQAFGPKTARRMIFFGRVSLFATDLMTSHVPLTLTLKPDASGARLDCRVGLPWTVLIVMSLIVIALGFAAGDEAAAGASPLGIGMTLAVAGLVIAALWFSGLLTASAHRGLLALVEASTNAKPISVSTVS